MTLRSSLKWIAGVALTLIALAVLFVAVFGWNWLRGSVERTALEKTGRELVIGGDLAIEFGWPHPRIHAGTVTFANPAWAREKQMVAAEAFEVSIDLPQLMRRNIVFPEVRLRRPVILLEQGTEGRKNWLLDLAQQDEGARIQIDRLMLDEGTLGYDDAAQNTSIRAELSTSDAGSSEGGPRFSAQGQFKGLPLKASGSGGPVLGLRDERTPYPLKGELSVGRTVVKGEGTITSLLKFSAVDMQLAVSGQNMAQLYPLLGIAVPETGAYATAGHIVRSGETWRYEKFSGRIEGSDIAGAVQVVTGGKRLHFGLEKLEAVTAVGLGVIHRGIRALRQGFCGGAVLLVHADADAHGHVKLVPTDKVRHIQCGQHFFATCAASCGDSISVSRTMNSSPPWRDTVSVARTDATRRPATDCSSSSPIACPSEGLMCLK